MGSEPLTFDRTNFADVITLVSRNSSGRKDTDGQENLSRVYQCGVPPVIGVKLLQTYDDARKRRPLPNEPNERMRYTLPGRKLVEDRAGGNPGKLLPIFGLVTGRLVCEFVMREVVVPLLNGHRFVELITVNEVVSRSIRWNRNFAFFACDDEVTKVSSVCTVETVFQSLTKEVSRRKLNMGRTLAPWPMSRRA